MRCRHCHREIDIAAVIWNGIKDCARRCIFCGALLSTVLPGHGQVSLPQGPQPPTQQQQMMFIGGRASNIQHTNTAAVHTTISFDP
ncbi:MAG: hypothetical protein ACXVZV_10300 [Terriglobales bacterium]